MDRNHELPLSPAQSVLWTGQQMHPEQPLYNMAFVFRLHGPLDIDLFRVAFNDLVLACEAMRLVFRTEGAVARQRVLAEQPQELVFKDASQGPEEVEDYLAQRVKKPFALSECCYDSVLVKVAEEEFIWMLNQHHLITDAWGISVQYRYLKENYERRKDKGAQNAGAENVIAAPLPSYFDYLHSLINRPAKPLPSYWAERKLPEPPEIYGRVADEAQTASHRHSLLLGAERMEQLETLLQYPGIRHWTRDLSLFNVLATLVFAFLHRVSGNSDLTIGTPAHNRLTADERNTPGCFIEVLPLVAEVDAEDTFLALHERVRASVNGFLGNARPGLASPDLLRGLNVILNYIHADFTDFSSEIKTTTEWVHPGHADAGHHLRFQVYDFGKEQGLRLDFDANQSIFPKLGGKEVSEHFTALLEAFLDQPDRPIAEVSLVKSTPEERIIYGPEVEETSFSVLRLFQQQLGRTPNSIAIESSSGSLTYASLDAQSGQLASFLNGRGAGQNIALFLPRSPELMVAILGVWKAGKTYLPIPADTPAGRVKTLLAEGKVDFVLSVSSLEEVTSTLNRPVFQLDTDWNMVVAQTNKTVRLAPAGQDPAYIMFTSGSTGKPKGVVVSHGALANYIRFARDQYVEVPAPAFPLFTMIGFDLTVTSLFTPLICGGKILIYEEPPSGTPDLAIFRVLEDDRADVIKLTPSHLALLQGKDFSKARVRVLIVGGENLRSALVENLLPAFPKAIKIYNEYGPTEATVGCVVHQYRKPDRKDWSVPIGQPIPGAYALVLDKYGNAVPAGVPGELFVGGAGLAQGYFGEPEKTEERFVVLEAFPGKRFYATGDVVRQNIDGDLEFLGRQDRQVKWRGFRLELNEIESILATHPAIKAVAVELVDGRRTGLSQSAHHCTKCGLPATYPSATFNEEGVCQLCLNFEEYQRRAKRYFRTMDDLKGVFSPRPTVNGAEYDCILLLSGGKDSTYALGQLVEMGLKVLAFTLDNGYISEQALDNVRRVASQLGVDCHVATTPAMNEIFTDSLLRHCNVCNGCFKTIYTLSTALALKKRIPYIVTGLSRGQFFETRLTEELFLNADNEDEDIDAAILEARKIYHKADDAVRDLLDTSMFDDDEVFEKVQFLDFYRYCDATLEEMLDDLNDRLPWERPTDTGRSTNCLINQVGIYVHKQEKGYNNYAFPYSWDVRIGHKERDAALEEINEEVDEAAVLRMMQEIGYGHGEERPDNQYLVAYFTSDGTVSSEALRTFLAEELPAHAIPSHFIPTEEMPLTKSGKIDREALIGLTEIRAASSLEAFVAPAGEIQEMLAEIWSEVLKIDRLGAHEKFIDLGGHSLTAIRLSSRISEAFELDIPLNVVFSHPTIATQSAYIEQAIEELLNTLE